MVSTNMDDFFVAKSETRPDILLAPISIFLEEDLENWTKDVKKAKRFESRKEIEDFRVEFGFFSILHFVRKNK